MNALEFHQAPLKTRPLSGTAFSFILGCAVCALFPIPFVWPACFALAALIGSAANLRRPRFHRWMVGAAFALGLAAASMAFLPPSPCAVRRLLPEADRSISLAGVIAYEPLIRENESGQRSARFPVRVRGLMVDGEWWTARGNLDVQVFPVSSGDPLQYGDLRIWQGRLERPPHRASGAFRLVCRSSGRRIRRDAGSRMVAACLRARRFCNAVLDRGLEAYPGHSGFYRALLLGERGGMSGRLYELFSHSGLLHLIAISGLHVGVMAAILVCVFRIAGLSRPYWIYGLAPALMLYTLATGLRPSAVRACVMALCFWAAPAFKRRPDGMNAMAFAAVVILLYNPRQIVEPGFQFSFLIVFALLISAPTLARYRPRVVPDDPWGGPDPPAYLRVLDGLVGAVYDVGAVSLTAWLVSAPLTAYYSNLLAPVSLAGNLLAVPLALVIVLTGCLSLSFGSSFVLLAEIFNHAARVFITLLFGYIEQLNRLPFGHLYVKSPPGWMVMVLYAMVAGLFFIHRGRRRMGGWMVAGLVAVMCAALAVHTPPTLDVLPRGRGADLLLQLPGQGAVLFDRGGRYERFGLTRHLRRRGVNRLQLLVYPSTRRDPQSDIEHWRRLLRLRRILFLKDTARHGLEHTAPAPPGVEFEALGPGDRLPLKKDGALYRPAPGILEITCRKRFFLWIDDEAVSAEDLPERETIDAVFLPEALLLEPGIPEWLADRLPRVLVFTDRRPAEWSDGLTTRVREYLRARDVRLVDLHREGAVRLIGSREGPLEAISLPGRSGR